MLDWADTAEAGRAPLVARNLVGLAGALVLLAVSRRDTPSVRQLDPAAPVQPSTSRATALATTRSCQGMPVAVSYTHLTLPTKRIV